MIYKTCEKCGAKPSGFPQRPRKGKDAVGFRKHSEAGGCSAGSGTQRSGACGDADPGEKCDCRKRVRDDKEKPEEGGSCGERSIGISTTYSRNR